ncbi:hypothetical protein NFI95_09800 [Acetobacteraceae bacterium KSS8]|uniref:NADH-quinone oxidoreductase subunit D domain-containing protein n=1 Tax=Endosaccharibacter trunci TaxID=2812733 RepID=A0ABT1W8N6_9PROT|nr:hypothetical protein [Acetobacteraceae bacterium KSS8]
MSGRLRVPAATLVRAGRASAALPATRFELSEAGWADLAERLLTDPIAASGLWSDGEQVHVLLLESPDAPLIASGPVEAKRFLALSPMRPLLTVPERMVRDLWGIEAMGARDLRPWLDHGMWTQSAPLASRPGPVAWPPEPPEFLWTEEDERAGAMALPIGPVQPLLQGPGQLRVAVCGERVRRLEMLLGSSHRGVALRLHGAGPVEAGLLVGRIDATRCVAYEAAFAQAVESAFGWSVDGPTRGLRSAMVALERIANRLRASGDVACRDRLLEACAAAFGHRLMRGAIGPGGWARRPDERALEHLPAALSLLEPSLARTDRPAEDPLETKRDLAIVRRGLSGLLPFVPATPALPAGVREGLGSAETLFGPLWVWVRFENGTVTAWHAVDPALARVHALEQAAPGTALDVLLAEIARLGLSVAGADQ